MRTAREIEDAAARAGGITIERFGSVTLPDGSEAITTVMSFQDPWAAARLLVELADLDAGDPAIRSWALAILQATAQAIGEPLGPTLSPALLDAFAAAIQENVKAAIKFIHEPEETFQSSEATIALAAGDCDDHARLVYALACAGGLSSELVFFEDDGSGLPLVTLGGDDSQPVHVVARILGSDGQMHWAETTIDADFGEEPHDAYDRLGGTGSGGNPFVQSSMGFLGLDFVTPGDVQTRKGELDALMSSLDDDVARCTALSATTVSAWNEFLVSWREFMAEPPSFWNAGGQGRQAQEYADALRDWQAKVNAVCPISGAMLPANKDDSIIGLVTAAAVVVTAATVAYIGKPIVDRLVRM